MGQRRQISQDEWRAMQNGGIPMIGPEPEPQEPEQNDEQSQEQPEEFQVSRDMYESIGRQYMQEKAPVPIRQQFAQMAGTPPQGEALIEWSRGTLFGVSIGIALGAGICYLVVRNYYPPENSADSDSDAS